MRLNLAVQDIRTPETSSLCTHYASLNGGIYARRHIHRPDHPIHGLATVISSITEETGQDRQAAKGTGCVKCDGGWQGIPQLDNWYEVHLVAAVWRQPRLDATVHWSTVHTALSMC
jgi:hypothetical protein